MSCSSFQGDRKIASGKVVFPEYSRGCTVYSRLDTEFNHEFEDLKLEMRICIKEKTIEIQQLDVSFSDEHLYRHREGQKSFNLNIKNAIESVTVDNIVQKNNEDPTPAVVINFKPNTVFGSLILWPSQWYDRYTKTEIHLLPENSRKNINAFHIESYRYQKDIPTDDAVIYSLSND